MLNFGCAKFVCGGAAAAGAAGCVGALCRPARRGGPVACPAWGPGTARAPPEGSTDSEGSRGSSRENRDSWNPHGTFTRGKWAFLLHRRGESEDYCKMKFCLMFLFWVHFFNYKTYKGKRRKLLPSMFCVCSVKVPTAQLPFVSFISVKLLYNTTQFCPNMTVFAKLCALKYFYLFGFGQY